MKNLVLAVMVQFGIGVQAQESIHEFEFKTLNGEIISFSDFKGKKILIVNTASECGFTPQYEGLEELHNEMGDDLVIIGFPANNFGEQEPGTDKEIATFCRINYGVTFQMAAKVSVDGEEIEPLFSWLTAQKNQSFTGPVKWNFEKFLLNEKGVLINRFRSNVKPRSKELMSKILK